MIVGYLFRRRGKEGEEGGLLCQIQFSSRIKVLRHSICSHGTDFKQQQTTFILTTTEYDASFLQNYPPLFLQETQQCVDLPSVLITKET